MGNAEEEQKFFQHQKWYRFWFSSYRAVPAKWPKLAFQGSCDRLVGLQSAELMECVQWNQAKVCTIFKVNYSKHKESSATRLNNRFRLLTSSTYRLLNPAHQRSGLRTSQQVRFDELNKLLIGTAASVPYWQWWRVGQLSFDRTGRLDGQCVHFYFYPIHLRIKANYIADDRLVASAAAATTESGRRRSSRAMLGRL